MNDMVYFLHEYEKAEYFGIRMSTISMMESILHYN